VKNRKKVVFEIILIVTIFLVPYLFASKLLTVHKGWTLIRTAVATADSDLGAAQRTYAYYVASLTAKDWIPAGAAIADVDVSDDNIVKFSFTFNDSAGTGTVKIYGITRPDSTAAQAYTPLEPICVHTLEAGTQETGDTVPRYYADYGVETSDYLGKVGTEDSTSGGNGVFKIVFDGEGYVGYIILFTAVKAEDNISVYGRYL
jgi:hypothetical protein